MNAATAVVVLAGGEGRRMGGGKPLRPFGDTTLVAHALAMARRWSPTVAVAVRSADQVEGLRDVRLLYDDTAIGGPAAGLASAFAFAAEAGTPTLLTLPCDAPNLPADLLTRLRAALRPPAGVAVATSLGRLHPACALWRSECGAQLPAYLEGAASLRGFATTCGMTTVDWDAEPGEDPFANANTPADLAALQPRRSS
ncbi:MAG: NTP transferase domain-containing protein [Caulobacteraceae bacterium]|nr:NTP transferase domain-containing protein [Caulobacteraceae bacterium]